MFNTCKIFNVRTTYACILYRSDFFFDFLLVLLTENPSDRLLFTTDGTDPKSRGAGNTHCYSGAFKLRSGKRTVKAMAVSRYGMAVIRCDMVVSR